jgi:KipI family sensor histidine kinase inhibitor
MTLHIRPYGPEALLIDLENPTQVTTLYAALLTLRASGQLPAIRDIVPAATTILLDGVPDPRALTHRLTADLATSPAGAAPPDLTPEPPTLHLPAHYDGPDLPHIANLWHVSPAEAARIHSETEFHVAFTGFAPGFGYLLGLPDHYTVPRRATPRAAVPPGSIGLAGPYTGVYPRRSPGGWQLIGTTDAVLWDPDRDPPALLVPGTRVRFIPQ